MVVAYRRASDNLQSLQEVRRRVDPTGAAKIDEFCARLDACCLGEQGFTLVLDDPAGNSFIETPEGKLDDDPQLVVEKYERTKEQREELGLLVSDDELDQENGVYL